MATQDIINRAVSRFGYVGTADLEGMRNKLAVPGVVYYYPLAEADGSIAVGHRAFAESLKALWRKFDGTGIYTPGQIQTAINVLDYDILPIPRNVDTVKNYYPAGPANLVQPDLTEGAEAQAWQIMVADFKSAYSLYLRKQLAAAKDAADASAARVEFWNKVEAVVSTVADLPNAAAGKVFDLFTGRNILMLGALVVVGYIVFTQRETLAKKVAAKVLN